jgi:hypothetical protein
MGLYGRINRDLPKVEFQSQQLSEVVLLFICIQKFLGSKTD